MFITPLLSKEMTAFYVMKRTREEIEIEVAEQRLQQEADKHR